MLAAFVRPTYTQPQTKTEDRKKQRGATRTFLSFAIVLVKFEHAHTRTPRSYQHTLAHKHAALFETAPLSRYVCTPLTRHSHKRNGYTSDTLLARTHTHVTRIQFTRTPLQRIAFTSTDARTHSHSIRPCKARSTRFVVALHPVAQSVRLCRTRTFEYGFESHSRALYLRARRSHFVVVRVHAAPYVYTRYIYIL